MAASVLVMTAALRIVLLFLLLLRCNADVIIVASERQPLSHLTVRQLKDLYLGRQPDIAAGNPIQALDQRNGRVTRQLFYQLLLGKSEAQIDAYWARLEFAGHVSPLQQMADDQAVLRQLQKDPSLIGYVQTYPLPSDVKILFVLSSPP